MIEQTILGYLTENLGVPVLMELPEVQTDAQWPERFVIVERVGTAKADHVSTVSIAFQSYSMKSLYQAADLNEQVCQTVENMAELDSIGGVHLTSCYNFTDTRTKRYRYQCVYDITFV